MLLKRGSNCFSGSVKISVCFPKEDFLEVSPCLAAFIQKHWTTSGEEQRLLEEPFPKPRSGSPPGIIAVMLFSNLLFSSWVLQPPAWVSTGFFLYIWVSWGGRGEVWGGWKQPSTLAGWDLDAWTPVLEHGYFCMAPVRTSVLCCCHCCYLPLQQMHFFLELQQQSFWKLFCISGCFVMGYIWVIWGALSVAPFPSRSGCWPVPCRQSLAGGKQFQSSLEFWRRGWVHLHENSTKLGSVCSCQAGHLPRPAESCRSCSEDLWSICVLSGRGSSCSGMTIGFGPWINSGGHANRAQVLLEGSQIAGSVHNFSQLSMHLQAGQKYFLLHTPLLPPRWLQRYRIIKLIASAI